MNNNEEFKTKFRWAFHLDGLEEHFVQKIKFSKLKSGVRPRMKVTYYNVSSAQSKLVKFVLNWRENLKVDFKAKLIYFDGYGGIIDTIEYKLGLDEIRTKSLDYGVNGEQTTDLIFEIIEEKLG